jgi:chromosome segregation ATPase
VTDLSGVPRKGFQDYASEQKGIVGAAEASISRFQEGHGELCEVQVQFMREDMKAMALRITSLERQIEEARREVASANSNLDGKVRKTHIADEAAQHYKSQVCEMGQEHRDAISDSEALDRKLSEAAKSQQLIADDNCKLTAALTRARKTIEVDWMCLAQSKEIESKYQALLDKHVAVEKKYPALADLCDFVSFDDQHRAVTASLIKCGYMLFSYNKWWVGKKHDLFGSCCPADEHMKSSVNSL